MITPNTLDKQHSGEKASSDGAENTPTTDSAESDLEALEARIDELEAGMKAVASSVEDAGDHIATLADRLDELDAPAETAETEPTTETAETEPTTDFSERMFQ
jgi:outer membrane murein-binding lipoprotein Lpp